MPALRLSPLVPRLAIDHPGRVEAILRALDAGLEAVDPTSATASALERLGPLRPPVTMVALGKAAPGMVRGALTTIPHEDVAGVVAVTDHEEEVPPNVELLIGDHPIPGRASLVAGRALVAAVMAAPGRVLALVSGGGSALAEVPHPHLTLEDVAATYEALLRAGVPISESNAIRTRLSTLKGGRLGALAKGQVVTVVMSDVAGGPEEVASGPTIPTEARWDLRDVIDRWDLGDLLPRAVVDLLLGPTAPPVAGGESGTVVVAGDGRSAARAVADHLATLGRAAEVAPNRLAGIAADEARRFVDQTRDKLRVASGETTVVVRGSGVGGRNQEAALAAAIALEGRGGTFVALGTDGIDGPTPAAGAVVDGGTVGRMVAAGVDPARALAENDAHTALAAAGALLTTGPTGVNVADLWVFDPGD